MKDRHKVAHMLIFAVLFNWCYRIYIYVYPTDFAPQTSLYSDKNLSTEVDFHNEFKLHRFPALDNAVAHVMHRATYNKKGVSCTVALFQDGQLRYAQAYGDPQNECLIPSTRMRIGGLTQYITRAALEKLVADGWLSSLHIPFWQLLIHDGNNPLPLFDGFERPKDTRITHITVHQLLNHMGGWSSDDASYHMNEAAQALDIYWALPKKENVPSAQQIIGWTLARHILDHDPGTNVAVSPLGYMILGRVIEKVSGMPYLEYINNHLCNDNIFACGATPGTGKAVEQEIAHYITNKPDNKHGFYLQSRDAADGLVASAPDLAQFFDAYLVSGNRRRCAQVAPHTKRYLWGTLPTTTACVGIYPEHKAVLALLINTCAADKQRCQQDQEAVVRAFDKIFVRI